MTIRSFPATALSGFHAVFGGGCVGILILFLLTHSESPASYAIAAGVSGGLALIRSLQISIRIGPEGATIANYFSTRRLSWAEVAAIGWNQFWFTNGWAASIAFRCRDGETVVSQAGWGLGRRRRERVVEALQEVARARELPCYLAPDDIKASTRRHENEPLSTHPLLPKVDRRIAVVRHHPWLGWVIFAAFWAAFALFAVATRVLFR